MKKCSIDGCDSKHVAKGFCQNHYYKNRTYGDPLVSARKPVAERLWARVDKSGDCWIWTGGTSDHGYGAIWNNGKVASAHRVAFELENGPIPDGLFIDHICHNPPCVNPQHLRLATNKQNMENRSGADKGSRTGIRGVYWSTRNKSYQAAVQHDGKNYWLGYHDSLAAAEAIVTAKRNELFTHNDADRNAA